MSILFIPVLISFFTSFFGLYVLIPVLKRITLQKPNLRSSHKIPKPTGGGILFVLISSFILLFLNNKICLFCLPLAIVGFLDDVFNLKRNIRYFSQVLTAILIINGYEYINNISLPLFIFLSLFLIIFTTAAINFTNFMDGIDGMISSCFIVLFAVCAVKIDSNFWILVSSLFGFLLWNWYPSKVFMGDVGSTFLGAVFVALLLKSNIYTSIQIFLVGTPVFLDALICVLRRLIFFEPIFKAHNLHLYQRLFQAGWAHSKVTSLYLFSTLILAFCVLTNSLIMLACCLILIICLGIYLDNKVAIPFKIALDKSNLLEN
tara:strand:+ start:170 stop:1123 length:954 start_codon:yes stop_codon:yes gene_type:complete